MQCMWYQQADLAMFLPLWLQWTGPWLNLEVKNTHHYSQSFAQLASIVYLQTCDPHKKQIHLSGSPPNDPHLHPCWYTALKKTIGCCQSMYKLLGWNNKLQIHCKSCVHMQCAICVCTCTSGLATADDTGTDPGTWDDPLLPVAVLGRTVLCRQQTS